MSLFSRAGRLALALVFLSSMTLSPALWAGAFIFAGEANGINVILHPTGYTGTGGVLNLGVCIDPASQNAQQLVIPVKNNISVWNELQPIANNVQTGVVSGIDAESVLLHEMGHCLGLAHVNAASESGLGGSDTDYTKATDGANNVFNINAGPDGVKGSYDDIRGDDVNLHWFNPANDPFQLPIHTPVDTTQYKRDISNLPAGDSFAQNASRALAPAMGYPYSEAVMQQGTYNGETQRELLSDDASTIMLAASGEDEQAGTSDDYQIVLSYEGITTGSNCDITVIMEDLGGGLAYCSVGGSFIGTDHLRITAASMHLGTGYTYTFNTELRDGGGNQPPVAGNDSGTVSEDGTVNIAVLGNDSDPEDDPLDVTAVSNPTHGSASVNANNTVRYEPDGNYNGADSFSYTLSDGNGGTDTANVSMTVNPVNDFPVANNDNGVTTVQGTPVDIDVLLNDSDVDGDVLNVASVSNGTNGTVTNNNSYVTYQPNAGFTGQDSFGYTASDSNGGSDNATVSVDVQASTPDYAVADFNTVQGTLSGNYTATRVAGGSVQSVTETHSGGKPSRRSDSLEHIWQFNLTGGNHKFNVVAEGDFPGNDQDSAFQFQWSTSPNGGWQTMLSIPGGTSTYDIGTGVNGTVYVRVMDNDSTQGNTVLSSVSIDHMYFDGGAPVTDPPAQASGPSPGINATNVPVNATLSWNAGDGADEHILYFGTNPDPDSQPAVNPAPGGTSFNPGALATSTTYYWQVDERNEVGTTTGAVWHFTTASVSGPSELLVSSIALSTANAGKGRKNGRAVVTVVDDFGNQISGASVTGSFTGSFNQTVSGNTGGTGAATLTTSNNPQKRNISFTFCVDSITGVSGLTYNPGAPECQSY